MVKIRLERSLAALPLFSEGEIWWCSIGENVGTEIGGKGNVFERPMIILTKLDYRSFIGIPMTSKNKIGPWYFLMNSDYIDGTAVLIQVRYVDCKRLNRKICTINESTLDKLRNSFIRIICHTKPPAI